MQIAHQAPKKREYLWKDLLSKCNILSTISISSTKNLLPTTNKTLKWNMFFAYAIHY